MDLLLPSVPKGTYFELIPSELIREILLYLEYQDLDVLEVKEDLFWRLKITIDFPDADLDLILQFLSFNRPFNCPFKSKNTRPINITRKRMKDYDLKGPFCSPERAKRTIIITDIPKYLESFKDSRMIPRGYVSEQFSFESMKEMYYLIGGQIPEINLYKAIYFYIYFSKNNHFTNIGKIPSDKNYFLYRIYTTMYEINRSSLANLIRQHLRMTTDDLIIFDIRHERYSYMQPKY